MYQQVQKNKRIKSKEIYERGSKKYQWEQVQLIAQLGDLCYCLFGISQPHDREELIDCND